MAGFIRSPDYFLLQVKCHFLSLSRPTALTAPEAQLQTRISAFILGTLTGINNRVKAYAIGIGIALEYWM